MGKNDITFNLMCTPDERIDSQDMGLLNLLKNVRCTVNPCWYNGSTMLSRVMRYPVFRHRITHFRDLFIMSLLSSLSS